MQIREILHPTMVISDLEADTKEDALRIVAERLCKHSHVTTTVDHVLTALLNREALGSTGVGQGVAIPHAKLPGLDELVACFARAPKGVPFAAIDQKPANLLFVLLVPENSAGAHLKALARISRLLKDQGFRETLLKTEDVDELYQKFIAEEVSTN